MYEPIKLKAWDKKNKVWLRDLVMDVTADKPRVWRQTMQGKGIAFDWPDVELIRFTDVYDHINNDIWESDILLNPDTKGVAIVVFEDGGFWAKYQDKTISMSECLGNLATKVGNFLESPELAVRGVKEVSNYGDLI